jgi:hypothetical protein
MHTRVSTGRHPARLSLVLAVGLGLPNVTFASEWQQAGLRHADFARSLGSEGTRFDQEFLKWAADFVEGDCEVMPAANNLPGRERRRVELVGAQYCKPWNQAWRVCVADQPPSWCADPTTVAKELDKYFDTLATALKGSGDALQRYNLMAIVVAATGVHAITQFPVDRVDQWVAKSAVEFLRTATPTEAIQIAGLLQRTWFGLGTVTARHLKAYAASRVMSEKERRLVNDAASRRHAD